MHTHVQNIIHQPFVMLQKKMLLNDLYKHNSYVIDDVTAFLIGWHQIFASINIT